MEADYKAWSQRDLSQKRYVYWWANGVYFNVRLDEERTCVLVLIAATEDGTKELLAVVDGYRESTPARRQLRRARTLRQLTAPIFYPKIQALAANRSPTVWYSPLKRGRR